MDKETAVNVPQPRRRSSPSASLSQHVIHEEADLALSEVQRVDIRVRSLNVEITTFKSEFERPKSFLRPKQHPKTLNAIIQKNVLSNVSADFPSGTVSAIIGGSGSGKTTLLNVVAERMTGGIFNATGSKSFNGSPYLRSVRSAYVMQQDVLLPTLTVRETLRYAADLRLPPPVTQEQRRDIVERVILELSLKECADTRIGNNVHRGCSGGEKRRVSIGVQLLANPSVLFLDEPTTGLDATSALQIVRTLKDLARKGRTIVVSVHQPRSEIWRLLDNVVLLSRGSLLYSGSTKDALPYFKEQCFEIPPLVNPAEFLIDLAAIDNRSEEAEITSTARVESLTAAWEDEYQNHLWTEKEMSEPAESGPTADPGPSVAHAKVPYSRQMTVLTARTFLVTIRDPMGLAGSLFEAIGMGVLTGWIFLNLDRSLQGIRSREGALYTASSLQGYLILIYECWRLALDIQVFDRERNEGVVTVGAFLTSRRLARFLLEDFPVPVVFSVIFYFMVGFDPNAAQFFVFFSVTLLTHYIAVCLATLCVSVSREFAGSSLVANLAYTLQSMACGYFINSQQIPVYTRWLKYAAYVFWAFTGLAANEFITPGGGEYGAFYDCPYSRDPSDLRCKEYTGRFILDSLGFQASIWRPPVILLGFAVGFYLLAAVLLQFWRVEIELAKARKGEEIDHAAGKEKIRARSAEETRVINVRLDGYALDIRKHNMLRRRPVTLSILQPTSTLFESGTLNVIMGPSGSGKTSLLHSMAHRLHSTIATEYQTRGRMLFNEAVPSESVVRSLTSFVVQDDDALVASLTVKETLRFAAKLRLPKWMSTSEKVAKADDVLIKLGLKGVANNVVGDNLTKGISGGEKRRVSIAVQILTDPKILLLDEPTSGLDAFTAMSIMDVLQKMASEGRTIILTVHQARSDLFSRFGNVLLLARGGYPVYSGKAERMLSYFQNLGHECPQATNPADFALDIVSVDIQHAAREATSREKVRSLIMSWNSAEGGVVRQTSNIATPAELGSLRRQMNPFRITFPLVLHRSSINLRRLPAILTARLAQITSMGIILALFFAPLKHDYRAVQSRVGFIQEIGALYFVGMLQNIGIYPNERDVFYREQDDGAYSVEVFLLSYTLLEMPFEIIASTLFGILGAYAINLQRTVQMIFILAFNSFCIVNCGESIGILFNTFFSHAGFAVQITSILLSVANVLGGIMSLNVPSFLQALNHLSPVKYSFANVTPYAMENIHFTCSDSERLPNGHCPIENGEQVLQLYNLQTNAGLNIMALGVCTIIYRLLAYLVLKVTRMHWSLKSFRKASETSE
ncbi:MAG: hypothetical protein Q9227_006847 [Pyrenula ochraceoflavens]